MDNLSIAPMDVQQDMERDDAGYEAWSNCVRRLLGWADGEMQDWRGLFATGHTPRDVARAVAYADGAGD